jgi:hypothetical protein
MANLPKPLIGLLLGTVAFFALWMVALKPSSSTPGGSPNGVGQYQSAINKAHQAVATSNAANAKLGAPTATAPAAKSPTPAKVAPAKAAPAKAARAVKPAPHAKPASNAPAKVSKSHPAAGAKHATVSVAAEVNAMTQAVASHKVVAMLFYNPAAADDLAMKKELATVPTHHGEVVTLAVPVSELTRFGAITAQVAVVTAPTLIVIDPARQASTLTGFASQLEINQLVADALAAK